jgi:transposase InsO family protein
MTARALSERRSLQVIGMSASSFRYQTTPDRNQALRGQIVVLAQRHRRYGSGMIYLKLRQSGLQVNHKRVERLHAEARLQVKRRKRKKVPVTDRQPLVRPQAANQVCSMDFVFDRTAEGRVIKDLTVVVDATHEAVAIVPERAIGGHSLTRILDGIALLSRAATGDPHGQRQGVLRPCHADLGTHAWREAISDRAGQAKPECLHRVVQRALPRRMPERALVYLLPFGFEIALEHGFLPPQSTLPSENPESSTT